MSRNTPLISSRDNSTTVADVWISSDQWVNYTERVDLLTTVVCAILDMLATNPMIAVAVGPQFVEEATAVSMRLAYLRDNVS